MEIWGGLECSIVRVGNAWRDLSRDTGHYDRWDDLDRIAQLGIKTLRYPILWESVAPDDLRTFRWDWHDRQLRRLQELGIEPIAGLLHHGSGPHYTELDDPDFADKLAEYALKIAARYPWIKRWTPVNEPVTTARFSGLYGHWYPHHCDTDSFLRMLVNQCHGVLLSMQAIRSVIPAAQLIQTEDIGHTFAAASDMQDQADYNNDRGWLSYDLLMGDVDHQHPFWHYLESAMGPRQHVLAELAIGAGAPDIMGVNHYLTSERYLDSDVSKYPECCAPCHGHEYVDVEAVRIEPPPGPLGMKARLLDVWRRYRKPMAVTEVHHGCDEEIETIRWLREAYSDASSLRGAGVDVRALTVWAMLGSVDWRTLLTSDNKHYEPAVFDVSRGHLKLTRLGKAVRELVRDGALSDQEALMPGWWRRPERVYGYVAG